MAKFYTYTFIVVGIAVLFSITGMNTGMTTVISWISSITNGNIGAGAALLIVGGSLIVLGAAGAASLIPGLTIFSKTDLVTTAGLGLFVFAALIVDFTTIITYAHSIDNGWVYNLTLLIMIPAVIGYLLSLYDWVRGAYN